MVRFGLHSYQYHTSHTLLSHIISSVYYPKASTFCWVYNSYLRLVPEWMTHVFHSYSPGALIFSRSKYYFMYDIPLRVILKLSICILLILQLLSSSAGSIILMTSLYESYPRLLLWYLIHLFPILRSSSWLLVLLCIWCSIQVVSDVYDSGVDSYPNQNWSFQVLFFPLIQTRL